MTLNDLLALKIILLNRREIFDDQKHPKCDLHFIFRHEPSNHNFSDSNMDILDIINCKNVRIRKISS